MPKPILFIDFDGTLCYDRLWRSLRADLSKKVQELLFQDDKTIIDDWMRGGHTSEGMNKFVASKLGIDYSFLWDVFVRDCKTMRVSPATLNKIQCLKKRFNVVLITGNMDCFNRFTVPSLGLDSYFDQIVCSYNTRKLKTDNNGEEFLRLTRKFGVDIKDCIVIDDSQGVCDIFKKLGGRVFLVTQEKDVDYYLSLVCSLKTGGF